MSNTIEIYGQIGWEVTPGEVRRQVAAADPAAPLEVKLHTPGGSVMDGIAILTNLRGHPAGFQVQIDGLAASMGAVIAVAADRVTMSADGWLMFHRVKGGGGTAKELREQAAIQEKMETGMILRLLKAEMPGLESEDAVLAALDSELWIDGPTALKFGFVDELLPGRAMAACWRGGNWDFCPEAVTSTYLDKTGVRTTTDPTSAPFLIFAR